MNSIYLRRYLNIMRATNTTRLIKLISAKKESIEDFNHLRDISVDMSMVPTLNVVMQNGSYSKTVSRTVLDYSDCYIAVQNAYDSMLYTAEKEVGPIDAGYHIKYKLILDREYVHPVDVLLQLYNLSDVYMEWCLSRVDITDATMLRVQECLTGDSVEDIADRLKTTVGSIRLCVARTLTDIHCVVDQDIARYKVDPYYEWLFGLEGRERGVIVRNECTSFSEVWALLHSAEVSGMGTITCKRIKEQLRQYGIQ